MTNLIVISHHEVFPEEASILQQLFVEGLACFHLRKPGAAERQVRQLLQRIPAEYQPRIALHGFHHLADEYGTRRLHFPEHIRVSHPLKGDPPSRESKGGSPWQDLKDAGYVLSTSVHDLVTLQQLPPVFAYAFFSPVFNSISKEQYKGIASGTFRVPDAQKSVPVIALGGIDESNIQSIVTMNFDGAAMLGAIWNNPREAVERFKLIKARCEAAVNAYQAAKTGEN